MSDESRNEAEALGRHPFVEIDVPHNILDQYDDQSIFAYVVEQLQQRGIYREGLVYAGMDGSRIHASGFGGRLGIRGWTEATILEAFDDGTASTMTPIGYMVDILASQPALAVFDPSKLKAGLTHHAVMMDEIEDDQLKIPDQTLRYWRTRDDSPLDEAAVAVFMFRTE